VDTKLIDFAKVLELKGYYFNIEPGVEQYFVREPGFDLSLGASFEFKDFKTLSDDLKTSFDRMRVVKAGPRVSWIDPWGNSEARADVHQGIPEFFGGSDAEDNATSNRGIGTGGQFTYYTAEAQRIQKLFFPGFILLRGTGQWSRESLTAVEQIRIGGLYSVRGYPTADAIGDYGYDFTAELDIPIYFIPADWKVPGFRKTWWQAVQLVGFIDGGKAFTRERFSSTDVKDRFLLGTGGGIRVNLKPNFSLEVYVGIPIGDRSTDENNPITHVALTAGF
jgi:hemolysin activation/secretion protein